MVDIVITQTMCNVLHVFHYSSLMKMPVTTKLWNHLGYVLFFINNWYHDLGISDGRRRDVLHTCFQHMLLKAKSKHPDIQSREKLMFFYMVGAQYSTLVFNVFC